MKQLQLTVSSLEKIFPYKKPTLIQNEYSSFKNETFHFQVACYSPCLCEHCKVEITSTISSFISVRKVELVPAGYAVNIYKTDNYVINKKPNGIMYPDLLRPLFEKGESLRQNIWNSFWVTVDGSLGLPIGKHEIKIRVYSEISGYDKTSVYTLIVLDDLLPENDLFYTCWMHYDCICDKHGVELFTPEYYSVFKSYLNSAVKHGMTMLYVPLFTPSMDTGKGSYRRPVQLVKIKSLNGEYSFDFTLLDEFIDFALNNGIKYLELCHLATQWGAKHCPQIMAEVDGQEKRIFGWETESTSNEYFEFLNEFLFELKTFVKQKGIEDIIYFHISDEPPSDAIERFKAIKSVIVKYFPNAKLMDAVCEKVFVESGVVTNPVVGTDHYKNIPCDWVYYCCVQTHSYLSNRLFNMPSQRTRILGMQLYRNSSTGFLQWGFNFYHSAGSFNKYDPYFITDAGGQFQSGDSFIVYPTNGGVLESLRHEVLASGFDDYRALKLLEKYIGKEKVIKLLDKFVKAGYTDYKRSAKGHLHFRFNLNNLIMENKK